MASTAVDVAKMHHLCQQAVPEQFNVAEAEQAAVRQWNECRMALHSEINIDDPQAHWKDAVPNSDKTKKNLW